VADYQPVRLTRTFRVFIFVFGLALLLGCPFILFVMLAHSIPFRPMGLFWLAVELAAGVCAMILAFQRRH
jgi:hypothetical protein